ncbi:WG repeat-containing protein [Cytophagaceae bacterium ABcell3]|nr:WG repeat-containing protein [Cytophagaceae bacterium ABcell3]
MTRFFRIACFILAGLSSGFAQDLHPAYNENGYYGYKNKDGEFYVKPLFLSASPFSEGLAKVRVKAGSKGGDYVAYLASTGKYAFPERFSEGRDFSAGFAAVKLDTGWFFINQDGKKVSNLVYEEALSFSSDRAIVKYEGKWGVIDTKFRFVIPPVYNRLGWPDTEHLPVEKQPFFIDGLLAYKAGDLWGLLNSKGKVLSKPVFDYIGAPSEKLMKVQSGEQWNFVNAKGKLISKTGFSEVYDFSQGLAAVRFMESGKIGFVNHKGKKVIEDKYDQLFWTFKDGLAIVGKKSERKLFCGVIDKKGRVVVPFEYPEAGEIMYGLIPVKNKLGQWMFYSADGKKVQDEGFDQYRFFENSTYVAVLHKGKWGIMGLSGKMDAPHKYSHILEEGDEIVLVNYNKWKVSAGKNDSIIYHADSLVIAGNIYIMYLKNQVNIGDRSKQVEIKALPDLSANVHPNFLLVQSGKKYGVLTSKGSFLLPLSYQSIQYDTTGYFLAFSSGTGVADYMICVDTAGKKVFEGNYVKAGNWSGKHINIKHKDGLWGFAGVADSLYIEPQFRTASSFRNGYAMVSREVEDSVKYGFINHSNQWKGLEAMGKFLSIGESCYEHPGFREVLKLNEHLLSLRTDDGFQLADTSFNLLQPVHFSNLSLNDDGQVVGVYKEEAVVFSAMGVRRYSFQHGGDEMFAFSEGFARIKKGRHFGYVDMKGRLRVSPQYDSAQDFSEGLAAVMLNGKWGFIDQDEKFVIQPRYSYATSFSEGVAKVEEGKKWNFIDLQGKLQNSTFYHEVMATATGTWVLRLNDKFGLADSLGREVINCRYDRVEDTGHGVIVSKDGKVGVLDYEQNFVFDLKYDNIYFNELSGEFLLMKKGFKEKFVLEQGVEK